MPRLALFDALPVQTGARLEDNIRVLRPAAMDAWNAYISSMLKRNATLRLRSGRTPAKAAQRSAFQGIRPGQLSLVAVHSGLGAGDEGTAQGPRTLAALGLDRWLAEPGVSAQWHHISADMPEKAQKDEAERLRAVTGVASRVASAVEQTIQAGRAILVIGGDHSIAVGSWSGAANALPAGAKLGLVWLDAHMDSHVPETSPSGNWHGMPLAHLLGYGAHALTGLARNGPAIHPEDLCLIGARSFEPEEARLLERLGVRIIAAEDVARRGFAACFEEALRRVREGTAGFGVSLDLDVIDPAEAPGVGSPVAGGLAADAIIASLRGLRGKADFLGLEIAEFNPARDVQGKTADIVRRLIEAVFGPGEQS